MSTERPSDDRVEPASDELSGDDAGRSAAAVSFPSAAAEVLKPFQQLVTPTSSASAAQQAMARIAQDAADISRAIASSPAAQLAESVEQRRRKFAEIGADAAHATAGVADWGAGWKRLREQQSEWAQQVAGSIQRAVDGFAPWIKKAATKVGEEARAYYRRAAPPNWITDEMVRVDFITAVRLSLSEGIPLAWVPDPETVQLLLGVAAEGPERRPQLTAILEERSDIIVDYCDTRLDEIARNSGPAVQLQNTIRLTRQAVQAVRVGLDGPAQSAAANLLDQLLRNASITVFGDYRHTKALSRVQALSSETDRTGVLAFVRWLGVLREVATLMPVATAMTAWNPASGQPPPEKFSRHVVAHFIAAEGQVSRSNALVAVMTAVSLLSQQHDSNWGMWKILQGVGTDTPAGF
ncbi:hypothetical protein ACWEF6_21295 [Amycolatopsis sp. NPDC004772]